MVNGYKGNRFEEIGIRKLGINNINVLKGYLNEI